MGNMWHWGLRLVAGGGAIAPPLRGLVDTAPLRHTLERIFHAAPHGEIAGIARNLEEGRLRGLAIMTSSYATGRAVAWVQGCDMEGWDRPFRESVKARITVDHVMASASLPILFPATRLNGAWYGDGGLRLSSPLSQPCTWGPNRILAVSTRHDRGHAKPSLEEQYPPPLQIAGQILNAIYLDDNDREAFVLERMNRLLAELPPEKRHGMRVIDLVQIRPSQDIGRLAAKFEPQLPLMFRHLVRGLGSRTSADPDLLSMLIFEPGYLKELIEIGEADAGARAKDIARLVGEAHRIHAGGNAMRHRLGLMAPAMLAVVVVACGGQAPATSSQAGQPSQAAGPAGPPLATRNMPRRRRSAEDMRRAAPEDIRDRRDRDDGHRSRHGDHVRRMDLQRPYSRADDRSVSGRHGDHQRAQQGDDRRTASIRTRSRSTHASTAPRRQGRR